MNRELSSLLRTAPLPGELEAQRRTWSVVQAAYAEREPRRRQRRAPRAVLAFAALGAVVAVAVSPVGGWIHDRFQGEPAAEPALFRLPSGAPGLFAPRARSGCSAATRTPRSPREGSSSS
jgi:hypothetical protein